VNLKGVFLGLKHEIPAMLSSGGGSIVNTSSVAGLVANQGAAGYAASKHGVIGLTRTAAIEYARGPDRLRPDGADGRRRRGRGRDRLAARTPLRSSPGRRWPWRAVSCRAETGRSSDLALAIYLQFRHNLYLGLWKRILPFKHPKDGDHVAVQQLRLHHQRGM